MIQSPLKNVICGHFELYWPPAYTGKYGYETTGKPAEVTVIAVDARTRA
jgi:hypothetical protein